MFIFPTRFLRGLVQRYGPSVIVSDRVGQFVEIAIQVDKLW